MCIMVPMPIFGNYDRFASVLAETIRYDSPSWSNVSSLVTIALIKMVTIIPVVPMVMGWISLVI